MRNLRVLLITLSLFMLAACATMRPQPPEVQLAGLEISDLSLSHANFLATLRLFNPNSMPLSVEAMNFTLSLNDVRIAKGQSARSFNLPADAFGEATLRLSSSFLDLFQLTKGLQGQEQISFRITGAITIGGMGILNTTVPIDQSGSLPLTGSLQKLVPEPAGANSPTPAIPGQDRLTKP